MAKRHRALSDFLADLLIEPPEPPPGEDIESAKLTLSTIHSAKGLEWDTVVVLGLTEGIFPDRRSLADEENAEEERRLFYVAVTRARRRLILVSREDRPSRFIVERPVELALDERSTSDEGVGFG